jgi:hypothetical protein
LRVHVFAALLALLVFASAVFGFEHTPSLLLSPKLLRRLQRDHTRQTIRWQNFENRVVNVPDSPERGFELALYYAVTHQPERGREAIAWALTHPNEPRQAALVLDWTADLITPEQAQKLKATSPHNFRDRLFLAIASDTFVRAEFVKENRQAIEALKAPYANDHKNFYAAIEYVAAYRTAARSDLRETDVAYFRELPKILLLSLTPPEVEQPNWIIHAAALALVTLDPNLESSQFLQGWAMESTQTLRDGPGAAYELLWADPYLPGIAYQNMDPWVYVPSGLLCARTTWEANACWIRISADSHQEKNCSATQLAPGAQFGSLTLLQLNGTNCAAIPQRKNRGSVAFWNLPPGALLAYEIDQQRIRTHADAAGIWLVPNERPGRVCLLN